jgi:hypothetical protein
VCYERTASGGSVAALGCLGRTFCELCEAADRSPRFTFLASVTAVLTELFSAIQRIDGPINTDNPWSSGELGPGLTSQDCNELERRIVGTTQVDYYWTVENPMDPTETPRTSLGSLADDLVQIYSEIWMLQRLPQDKVPADRIASAWVASFRGHWGSHLLAALSVCGRFTMTPAGKHTS